LPVTPVIKNQVLKALLWKPRERREVRSEIFGVAVKKHDKPLGLPSLTLEPPSVKATDVEFFLSEIKIGWLVKALGTRVIQ
jgi:hypothetical protein